MIQMKKFFWQLLGVWDPTEILKDNESNLPCIYDLHSTQFEIWLI